MKGKRIHVTGILRYRLNIIKIISELDTPINK